MNRGDPSVRRWYPRIAQLSSNSAVELRQTAAWLMGQDKSHEPFRSRLRAMLGDDSVLVRRNAALSLAGWRDPAARPELDAMLRPFTVASPAAGAVKYRPKTGEYVNVGTLLARVGEVEVRAPVPGEILVRSRSDGAQVTPGEPLIELSPDESHAWEALRALYLVGTSEDAAEVSRYARATGASERLQQQAALTLNEIRKR